MSYAIQLVDQPIVRMVKLYTGFGPARVLKIRVTGRLLTDQVPSSLVAVPAPKQANCADDWFATSHVWYMHLPKRVLRCIQPSLFNTLFA